MRLLSLGVDHHSSPTAVREGLAFEGPTLQTGLVELKSIYPASEFVVLSTCNRVELYAAGDDAERVPDVPALARFLADFHRMPADVVNAHVVAHHDDAVVGHLFRVSASLESLVLGEGQILGQVRDAYRAADKMKSVGPILHELFQQAIRVGKRVREETGMDRGKLSIASVAVDLAREVFDTFSDKTVLVIGAGKMADLTLQHMAELRPGRIVVANRNPERAAAVAERWGGRAVPMDRLGQALIEADVVVSTTAAAEPIVTYEHYARVQRSRRNRLALILDIAVPRDFEEQIGELQQVMLYNVDDLKAQVERNLQDRLRRIDPAQAIIDKETAACLAQLRHRHHAGALLSELNDSVDSIRNRELERLFAAHPGLEAVQREAIAHMAQRLQNQFLHHPRTALRTAASTSAEHPHSLLAAVRHLFGLRSSDGYRAES